MLTLTLILMMNWIVLGWCWTDALVRLDAVNFHHGRSYILSFIFWPFSMMHLGCGTAGGRP